MTIEQQPASTGPSRDPINEERLTDAERSALFELRAYRETWLTAADETVDFAFNEAQTAAQEFLKTHPDAREYALFQIIIGGTEDASLSKIDYPDGSLLELARGIDKRVRDFQTGTLEEAA